MANCVDKYKIIYTFSSASREDHGNEIYGCQFNAALQSDNNYVFATVGSNRISIYECTTKFKIKLLQSYHDPCKEEVYYCCVWTHDTHTQCPLIIAGGERGIIRVINAALGKCVQHFIGHGGAINDIKIHPKCPELLLSASKDHSIRLWNIESSICIAIFGPFSGHRDQVLCIDFHLSGDKFISGGMDHSLKIWNLQDEHICYLINKSRTFCKHSRKSFKPYKESVPIFTTRDVHTNYVDTVKFYGDLVISKSCQSEIVLWKPGGIEDDSDYEAQKQAEPVDLTKSFQSDTITVIRRFYYDDGDLWYMRFGINEEASVMAVGNRNGKIYVWDINVDNPFQMHKSILEHPKCIGTVRQITMSNDGSILLCVTSDARIWRWDRVTDVHIDGDMVVKSKNYVTHIHCKEQFIRYK